MQNGTSENNYLTSIVARTLNIAPLVRPRLRGRFDPVPTASREPVDPSLLDRTVPSDSSRKTENAKVRLPREDAGRLLKEDSVGRRDISIDLNVRPPEHSIGADGAAEPPLEETAPVPTRVLDQTATSAPGTIRAEVAEAVQENLSREDPRVSAPITEPASAASHVIEKPPRPTEHEAIRTESWTVPPFQPPSRRLKDNNVSPESTYLSARAEPGPQATIQAEEPLADLSSRVPEAQPKSGRDATPQYQDDSVGSMQQRVVVPTRIAPRVEIGPERFLLSRQPSPQPQSTIHVTIGRVEVRAVRSAQPARSSSKDNPSQPVMKLDEYLRGRNQGSGR
jgi:hypothetical protein